MTTVEETRREALRPLEKRQQDMEREAEEFTQELQKEIRQLRDIIGQLEDVAILEDHIHFLQVSDFP
jgi:prefoldin subunit 5